MDCFFIAHPKSGGKEGEESNRIMYYYPKTDSIDKQVGSISFDFKEKSHTLRVGAKRILTRLHSSSQLMFAD